MQLIPSCPTIPTELEGEFVALNGKTMGWGCSCLTEIESIMLELSEGVLTESDVRCLSGGGVALLNKGDTLIDGNRKRNAVTFLLSGIIRGWSLDSNGDDITDFFFCKTGSVIVPFSDRETTSPLIIEAMTSAKVLSLDIQSIANLLETSLTANQYFVRLLQDALRNQWDVNHMMRRHQAKGRFQWFVEKYPGLIYAIPNRYIASYLGMTPVTFSRLRSAYRAREGTRAKAE